MTTPVHIKSRAELQGEAEKFCDGGWASGGRLNNEDDTAKDKRMIRKAVGQHEGHDHAGKPRTDLKLKAGGEVAGAKPAARADKRARGGAMPESAMGHGPSKAPKPQAKGSGKGHVTVNIVEPAAAEGEKKQAAMQGLQAGAKLGAAQAARGMAPPGAGGPPPGAPPPRPMMPPPGAGAPPPGMMPPGQKRGGRAC